MADAVAPVAAPVAPATTPASAAAPVAPVVTPPAQPQAEAFAALAAKEKAFVAERQKFAAEREQAKTRDSEFEAWKLARADRLRNPDAYLKQDFGEGWYDKLTEYKLNGTKVTPELVAAQVDDRFAAFEKKQAEDRAAAQQADAERAKAAHAEAWQAFQTATADFVKSKPDDYELINAYGAHQRVVAVIEKTYAETGRILAAKEAADLVEADLLDVAKKSKKLQFQPPATGATKPPESAQPRTLTNAHSAISTPPDTRPLTDDERLARAIAKGEAVRKARLAATA